MCGGCVCRKVFLASAVEQFEMSDVGTLLEGEGRLKKEKRNRWKPRGSRGGKVAFQEQKQTAANGRGSGWNSWGRWASEARGAAGPAGRGRPSRAS
jgi:hypothetical protein